MKATTCCRLSGVEASDFLSMSAAGSLGVLGSVRPGLAQCRTIHMALKQQSVRLTVIHMHGFDLGLMSRGV